jgi:hypothetical protein
MQRDSPKRVSVFGPRSLDSSITARRGRRGILIRLVRRVPCLRYIVTTLSPPPPPEGS